MNGDPGMWESANLIVTSYSPGSVGTYSTEHDPSRLSLQVILASDGPSIANPNPPVPAPKYLFKHNSLGYLVLLPLVSTVNTLALSTRPWSKPGPYARHFFASQPLRTLTVNGDPGIGVLS